MLKIENLTLNSSTCILPNIIIITGIHVDYIIIILIELLKQYHDIDLS